MQLGPRLGERKTERGERGRGGERKTERGEGGGGGQREGERGRGKDRERGEGEREDKERGRGGGGGQREGEGHLIIQYNAYMRAPLIISPPGKKFLYKSLKGIYMYM